MILKWILQKFDWEGVSWIDLAQDMGKCSGCCENGDERSGYTKCGEIINYMRRCWLFKKGCSMELQLYCWRTDVHIADKMTSRWISECNTSVLVKSLNGD